MSGRRQTDMDTPERLNSSYQYTHPAVGVWSLKCRSLRADRCRPVPRSPRAVLEAGGVASEADAKEESAKGSAIVS